VRTLETLRILVAEDHPLFRKGMITLLSSVPEFEVVGEAATGEEAVARAADLQPDVVLMDLQMPQVNGIEATRRILQESPNVRILMVTLFKDDDSVFMALRAEARGYVLKDADEKMKKAVSVNREELSTIRSGRASPAILNRVTVDYYGTPTPLNQLASLSVPEPRMLVINPYDQNALKEIERAIAASDLGINPSSDGQVVRVVFPELTEERRKEFVRLARERAEEGRVAVRNVRRHAKDGVQQLLEAGDVPEDEGHRADRQVQDLTDQHVKRIDTLLENKEQELLEV
jgi:ribosome recycling factor